MKYHILMPFHRVKNKEKIIRHLKKFNVILHPIINEPIKFPKEKWIQPITFTSPKIAVNWMYYYALNKFIEKAKIIDSDYYMFLSDDDFLEPDFFKKLKGIKTDFIAVSMKRGNKTPPGSAYGTEPLICTWRKMGRRGMAGEQFILKGKYLKNEQFLDIHVADGKFIGKMWFQYPHDSFTFVPDAYVWFNYLEPGRWKKTSV